MSGDQETTTTAATTAVKLNASPGTLDATATCEDGIEVHLADFPANGALMVYRWPHHEIPTIGGPGLIEDTEGFHVSYDAIYPGNGAWSPADGFMWRVIVLGAGDTTVTHWTEWAWVEACPQEVQVAQAAADGEVTATTLAPTTLPATGMDTATGFSVASMALALGVIAVGIAKRRGPA